MDKYTLVKEDRINGKIIFYRLAKNDKCEFEDFCNKIFKGNYASELRKSFLLFDIIANSQGIVRLPPSKYKEITPSKEKVKEYELKSKNLRIYFFKHPNTGRVIICGGVKKTQKKDINHFRLEKKKYLKSIGHI